MNSIKSVIVDDNKKSIQLLRILISKYCPEIDIVGEATNYEDALELIVNAKPELVFLDMHLNHDYLGFDVIDKLSHLNFKVIVISTYEKYAIESFQYNVLDYLVKPFDAQKLIAAVDKAVSSFKDSLTNTSNQKKILSIVSTNRIDVIKYEDIAYLCADGRYTIVKLINGKKIICSTNLKIYEKKLFNDLFFRIHKSYLINVKNIRHVEKVKGLFCVMKGDFKIPISRRKKESFMKFINL